MAGLAVIKPVQTPEIINQVENWLQWDIEEIYYKYLDYSDGENYTIRYSTQIKPVLMVGFFIQGIPLKGEPHGSQDKFFPCNTDPDIAHECVRRNTGPR